MQEKERKKRVRKVMGVSAGADGGGTVTLVIQYLWVE